MPPTPAVAYESLKALLAHPQAQPLLRHNPLIIFIAPLDISLIQNLSMKPPSQRAVNFKTVIYKSSYRIHIHSIFLFCLANSIRLFKNFLFPQRISLYRQFKIPAFSAISFSVRFLSLCSSGIVTSKGIILILLQIPLSAPRIFGLWLFSMAAPLGLRPIPFDLAEVSSSIFYILILLSQIIKNVIYYLYKYF